eukprot:4072323-Pleurochrysis_carterae.AAC.1
MESYIRGPGCVRFVGVRSPSLGGDATHTEGGSARTGRELYSAAACAVGEEGLADRGVRHVGVRGECRIAGRLVAGVRSGI